MPIPHAPAMPEDYPAARAVMRASRVFTGILAETLQAERSPVTAAQLRVLVLLAQSPGVNASAVAEVMNVHLSVASRLVDRLVRLGLVQRRESADDRRNLHLSLSEAGTEALSALMTRRLVVVNGILAAMSPADRDALGHCLTAFCDAAGEVEGPLSLRGADDAIASGLP